MAVRREPWSRRPPPPRRSGLGDALWELRLVIRTQWRSWRGWLRADPDAAAGYTVAALLGVPFGLGLWLAVFFLMYAALASGPAAVRAPAVNLISGAFLLFGAVLTLVSAGATMAHSGAIPLLFTLPLRRRAVLAGLVAQHYLASLWAALFAAAPPLALLWSGGVLLPGLGPVLLTVLAAALCLTALAVAAAVALVRLLPAGRWQEWALTAASAAGLIGYYSLQGLAQRAAGSGGAAAYLARLGRWLPVWTPLGWSGGVAALAGHAPALAWAAAGAASVAGLLICWLLVNALDLAYRGGLTTRAAEAGGLAQARAAGRQLHGEPGWRQSPVWALARRDWRRLVRSPRLLAQPLLVAVPAVAYWLLSPSRPPVGFLRIAVPGVLTGVAAVAALTMIGNEEQGWWLTRLTPMSDREIVYGKALAVWGLVTVIGLLLLGLVAPLLGLDTLAVLLGVMHIGAGVWAGAAIGLYGGCTRPVFTALNNNRYASVDAGLGVFLGTTGLVVSSGGAYAALRWALARAMPAAVVDILLTTLLLPAAALVGSGLLAAAARALPGAHFDR